MKIISIFLFITFCFFPAFSQNTKNNNEQTTVQWYRPEFIKPLSHKHHRIILQGVVEKGSSISIESGKIPILKEGEANLTFIATSRLMGEKRNIDVDQSGFFSMTLDVPYGILHIPIILKKHHKRVPYVLVLHVETDDLKIAGESRLQSSPFYKKRYGAWFGLGYNFILYKQGDLSFKSFTLPSWYLKLWHEIIPYLDFNITLKSSPGETTSNPNVNVTQGRYSWNTLGVELAYAPEFMEIQVLGAEVLFGIIGGLQLHKVPYIVQINANQTNVQTNDITMAALGGRILIIQSRRWEYEIFMRYEQVLSQGQLFDIESSSVFDGSLGAIYRFPNRSWRLGAFFYGQSFTYKSSRYNTITSQQDRLEQTLFFSNLELRLGYEFLKNKFLRNN